MWLRLTCTTSEATYIYMYNVMEENLIDMHTLSHNVIRAILPTFYYHNSINVLPQVPPHGQGWSDLIYNFLKLIVSPLERIC